MEFRLILSSTEDTLKKMEFIHVDWRQSLDKYFHGKDYGNDVQTFIIGVTCVNPEFEPFFKVRKAKYLDEKTETHDGFSVELKKTYEYGIRLEHKAIQNGSEKEIKKVLARAIIDSLVFLDGMPKKIKDFDKQRFKLDLESYFKGQGLI